LSLINQRNQREIGGEGGRLPDFLATAPLLATMISSQPLVADGDSPWNAKCETLKKLLKRQLDHDSIHSSTHTWMNAALANQANQQFKYEEFARPGKGGRPRVGKLRPVPHVGYATTACADQGDTAN